MVTLGKVVKGVIRRIFYFLLYLMIFLSQVHVSLLCVYVTSKTLINTLGPGRRSSRIFGLRGKPVSAFFGGMTICV